MGRILVIDDEPGVLNAFQAMLQSVGHEVLTAAGGREAIETIRGDAPDAVVSDLCMPDMDGLETFQQIRALHPRIPVIIMTGHGTMETAIQATKLGAFDYQLKPFEPESMLAAIERALDSVRLMRRSVEFNPVAAVTARDALIGDSSGMQEVYKMIGRVAATDATVLIRGESGTGKELVARALYQHSDRANQPLIVVNCAAIPDNLLESELFGYERGAFTGAHARRIGKFEQADGGTILLDEIGEIPLALQPKLLRALQQRTLERVGGNETVAVDVRVIAATNRPLEQAIADGTFREDLFYRLNVITISIPPVRERRSDIPKLVKYFMERYAAELRIENPVITDEALAVLGRYDWPGNVRELEHCVFRALIFSRGFPIQPSDIERAQDRPNLSAEGPIATDQILLQQIIQRYLDTGAVEGIFDAFMADAERTLLVEALTRTQGNQTHAARLLGLSRPTLHAKLQKHQIREGWQR